MDYVFKGKKYKQKFNINIFKSPYYHLKFSYRVIDIISAKMYVLYDIGTFGFNEICNLFGYYIFLSGKIVNIFRCCFFFLRFIVSVSIIVFCRK